MRHTRSPLICIGLLLLLACTSTPPNGDVAEKSELAEVPLDLATPRVADPPQIRRAGVSICETAAAQQPVTLTPVERAEAEVDIAEAVFRYVLDQPSKTLGIGEAFYLAMDDGDPPEKLLRRFADHSPPVRPESEMDLLSEEGKKSPHAELLRKWARIPGTLLVVHSFEWHSDSLVSVQGQELSGRMNLSGASYCLQNENGIWRLIEIWGMWLS